MPRKYVGLIGKSSQFRKNALSQAKRQPVNNLDELINMGKIDKLALVLAASSKKDRDLLCNVCVSSSAERQEHSGGGRSTDQRKYETRAE